MIIDFRLPLRKSSNCFQVYSLSSPARFGVEDLELKPSIPWHVSHRRAINCPRTGLPSEATKIVLSFHTTSDGAPGTVGFSLEGASRAFAQRSKGTPRSSEITTMAMHIKTAPRTPMDHSAGFTCHP